MPDDGNERRWVEKEMKCKRERGERKKKKRKIRDIEGGASQKDKSPFVRSCELREEMGTRRRTKSGLVRMSSLAND